MILLDGRAVRDMRKKRISDYVESLETPPQLVIIQIGNVTESSLYIEQKKIFGVSVGIPVIHEHLSEDVLFDDVKKCIDKYNADDSVCGIIVQLPVPENLDRQKVIDCIDPKKDVDGLTSENVQLLEAHKPRFVPATARGVMTLLKAYDINVDSKKAVVIGRSALVGKPTALLLEQEGAIVEVCHRQTLDVPSITRNADIIVVAAGHPNLVTSEYVREGQVVVDVGINTVSGQHLDEEVPGKKYIGDVHFDQVASIVGAISPVPGGVGPMTVLSLFENCLDAHMLCNNR